MKEIRLNKCELRKCMHETSVLMGGGGGARAKNIISSIYCLLDHQAQINILELHKVI